MASDAADALAKTYARNKKLLSLRSITNGLQQTGSLVVTAVGGLPIKVGDDTIAAIGVSGAPGGDKDEACAQSGLEKIKGSLQ